LKRKQIKKIIVFVIMLCMITGCSGLKPDEAVKNNPADNTDSNTHAGSAADKPAAPGQEESAGTAGNANAVLIPVLIIFCAVVGSCVYAYKKRFFRRCSNL
jgi:hypothetical protein